MNYFLSLELPLWWFFLPLIIAGLLTYRYNQSLVNLRKQKSKSDIAFDLQQAKLDELFRQRKELDAAISSNNNETLRLHKVDAVEREALIVSLNKQVAELTDNLNFKNGIAELDEHICKDFRYQIEQLKSKLELSELAHNETKDDLEGEKYYIDAIAEAYKLLHGLVVRNSRPKKQFDLALSKMIGIKRIAFENLNLSVLELANKNEVKKAQQKVLVKTIINDGRIEGIIHDSLGVPTVTQADQSEDFNSRHIQDLGSEVVRGIEQQNAAIKKELQGIDIGTLEVRDSVVLREMTIHSANKDSIKGMFSFNTANFTVSNGNQKQYAPIELYRFGSEQEYKDFVND